MFFKKKEFTPYPVSDKVVFRNGERVVKLTVKSDGGAIILNLKKAYAKIQNLTENSTEADRLDAAKTLAAALFGHEQAQQIADLYDSDNIAIMNVCGDYFKTRLSKIISKVQIKKGVK